VTVSGPAKIVTGRTNCPVTTPVGDVLSSIFSYPPGLVQPGKFPSFNLNETLVFPHSSWKDRNTMYRSRGIFSPNNWIMTSALSWFQTRRSLEQLGHFEQVLNSRGRSFQAVADPGFWTKGVKFQEFGPKPPILSRQD